MTQLILFFALALLADLGWAAAPGTVTTVKYMLWDSSQVPAYRQCASDFQQRHPQIRIRIRQAGWDDYWTAIATGFISETAPDVFVNHLAKYPEIVKNNLLLDLAPLMARDQVASDSFDKGLLQAWTRDGQQYGMPKDWDTIALLVNLAQARKQGVSLAELKEMDWNPRDGGRFEQVVKRLTQDHQGRNALHPQFDKNKVQVYGYQNPGAGGMTGQTQWSHFAVSNGFKFQDAPWSRQLHYDSPKLAQTIDYLASLPGKGLSAPMQFTQSLGADGMFISQKAAMIPAGAWMINFFKDNARFDYAWLPLPKGPLGVRASMLNGTADSIWIGSKVKAAAWQWVKYLGSAECQTVVARHGVVFPALRGTATIALQTHLQKGLDASAFVTMAQAQTFLAPIADNASQINEIIGGAIESVLWGKATAASALKAGQAQVNQLKP